MVLNEIKRDLLYIGKYFTKKKTIHISHNEIVD